MKSLITCLESILDDDDVFLDDNRDIIEHLKKEILDIIMNYKSGETFTHRTMKENEFDIDYDDKTSTLTINCSDYTRRSLYIPILDIMDVLGRYGFVISNFISDNKMCFSNQKDRTALADISINSNGVGFDGFDVIRNVTYTPRKSQQRTGAPSGIGMNRIDILDIGPVKLENFKYNGNVRNHPMRAFNDVMYKVHLSKDNTLRFSDIHLLGINKPIKGITRLVLNDVNSDKGLLRIMDDHFIPNVASFLDENTGKYVSANNIKKYLSMLKNTKRYTLKERVNIFDCDFRDILKFPDIQLIETGNYWSSHKLILWCNNQGVWDVRALRK